MKCVKYNAIDYRLVLRISISSYVINYHYIYICTYIYNKMYNI